MLCQKELASTTGGEDREEQDDDDERKRPRREGITRNRSYDETSRRKRKAKTQDSASAPGGERKRGKRVKLAQQIEVGRQTVRRTVGEKYDMDDGEGYRAKRIRDDAGEDAQRKKRLRDGRTEYDDGG